MTPSAETHLWQSKEFRLALLLIGGLTLLRVIILFLSSFNLGPDEAQYWDWSRDLDFGYFSKPPMIAWFIGLETWACGSTEACIRVGSPLLHLGTSMIIFWLAHEIFDARTGLWSSVAFATLPSVSFSAGIISTDVLLLFFWASALGALYKLLQTRELKWSILLGIALGFGFLSKYAMVYFLVGGILFMALSAEDRWLVTSKLGLIPLVILGLFLTPNLLWNLEHDFSTVSHTAANANWGVELFNPESLGDFIGDQFGIFGPIFFVVFIYMLIKNIGDLVKRKKLSRATLYLLSFSLPIILIVTLQSFISRANGNWAVTTYVAATLFVVAFLLEGKRQSWLKASLAIHIALAAFIYTLALNTQLIADLGLSNAFKRVRGWDVIGEHVRDVANERGSDIIMTENRLVLTELLYYAPPTNADFRIWDYDEVPENHYEMTVPMLAPEQGKVLLISRQPIPKNLLFHFEERRYLETFVTPVGKGKVRTLYLYELKGFNGRR